MCLFSINDDKCDFSYAIFFKGAVVYAMSVSGGICSSSKEAEVRAIFFALNIVREFELDNIIFFTDSLEVERRSDP